MLFCCIPIKEFDWTNCVCCNCQLPVHLAWLNFPAFFQLVIFLSFIAFNLGHTIERYFCNRMATYWHLSKEIFQSKLMTCQNAPSSIMWRTYMKALSLHDSTQKSKWEIFEKASFQNSGLMVTQWSVNLVKENIKMKGLEDLGLVWLNN